MSSSEAARRPRPSRERGRKRIDSMAYQRAMADLREVHREEFDRRWRWHIEQLEADQEKS